MGSVVGLFFDFRSLSASLYAEYFMCSTGNTIQYKSKWKGSLKTTISYTVFSFGLMGPILPLWFMKNAYIDSLVARGKDQSYIAGVFAHTSTAMLVICGLAVLVASIVGIGLGARLYQNISNQRCIKQTGDRCD